MLAPPLTSHPTTASFSATATESDSAEESTLDPEHTDANRVDNPADSNCSDIERLHETDTEQFSDDETASDELQEPRCRIPFYTGNTKL